jgi:hypothetical protein
MLSLLFVLSDGNAGGRSGEWLVFHISRGVAVECSATNFRVVFDFD